MRSENVEREVTVSGNTTKGVFAISAANHLHIMEILRDGLYTDRVLAVLREYSSNAWDAHRDAGKASTPIEVFIPTSFKPFFTVRDFGKGLSEHDALHLYTQYGESSKRDSDDVVGALGVGCKSAFSYSDSFTVTSWHEGTKKIYAAVLDASNHGEMHKIHEEPCKVDETGVEIQIPVQPSDIPEFKEKACNLFPYFVPPPKINITIPKLEGEAKKNGVFLKNTGYSGSRWSAVMGCIPYRLNVSQIEADLRQENIFAAVNCLSGWLNFQIGEVRMSANREELRYTESTKKALVNKFKLLVEEYIADASANLGKTTVTDWKKRLDVIFLKNSLGLRFITSIDAEWQKERIKFIDDKDKPKTFTTWRNNEDITVINGARFVINDTDASVYSYGVEVHDVVLTPVAGSTFEDVQTELKDILKKNRLSGITISKLSVVNYRPRHRRSRASTALTEKYKISLFQLHTGSGFHSPWSSCWGAVKHVPAKEDAYVILDQFKVRAFDFYQMVYDDLLLAKNLGLEMPPIFGYRRTTLKPGTEDKIVGTPYQKWRKEFFAKGWAKEHKSVFLALEWREHLSPSGNMETTQVLSALRTKVPLISEKLGATHPVTRFFVRGLQKMEVEAQVSFGIHRQTKDLCAILENKLTSKVHKTRVVLLQRYPMLKLLSHGFRDVLGKIDLCVEYIQLVDSKEPKP